MMRSILKEDIKDKLLLLRVDINSPVVNGKPINNPRIKEASKTISLLLKKGCKLAVIAHQGRKGDNDFISLKEHAKIISKNLKKEVNYVDYLFESNAKEEIKKIKLGQAIILKNVREYSDEKEIKDKNNAFIEFSKQFDIFVNDAFSVSHRKQGSIILPPKYISSFMGPSLENEIYALNKFKLKNTSNVFIIGGSKIEDYFHLFQNLKNRKNILIPSGVLANLFLVAKGKDLGYENLWLNEKGYTNLIPSLRKIYKLHKKQIILPIDFAVLKGKKRKEYLIEAFPIEHKIWDLGHKTVDLFKKNIKKAKSIFMKGPLGYSEMNEFSYATVEILKEISYLSKNKGVFSLLGGGHLTTSIDKYKIPNNFSHISLSGGALIAYISGQSLPGLTAIER